MSWVISSPHSSTVSDPTTTNPTATLVNTVVVDILKGADSVASTAIESALDTAAPFFTLPVIKEITDFTIEEGVAYVGDKISIGLQTVGTFVVIDTQVNGEKTGISKALAALMLAEKSGDQNAIQTAIVAYQAAQSALTHDDGSAPISG